MAGDNRLRPLWRGGLLVFLVLVATVDERTFGTVTDEIQVLGTAIAVAEFGEVGIARGQPFTVHRPGGDAAAPYGMGLALVQAIPAFVAAGFEGALGAGSSQTLFVLAQVGLITLASIGAGLLAHVLGASDGGVSLAVLGTGIGSPLWAYAATNYSEPYQATAIVYTLTAAVAAVRARSSRDQALLAALAGLLMGLAVLGKVVNLAIAPFLLMPLLLDRHDPDRKPSRWRWLLCAAAGSVPALGLWLAFEMVRYGGPLLSYAGHRHHFTNPVFDGAWRLLVGPSKGLVLYFPLAILAVSGCLRLGRSPGRRGAAISIAVAFSVLLSITAAWWGWDGFFGWGPRLLVPIIPLLGAAAGLTIQGRLRSSYWALVLMGLGVTVNLLGVLQPESAVMAYVASMRSVRVSEEEARRLPPYAVERLAQPHVPRPFLAARDPTLSPLRTHLFVLSVRITAPDRDILVQRLSAPPWLARAPELAPVIRTGTVQLAHLQSPFTWPHLGRALFRPGDDRALAYNMAWIKGIEDQTLRALDVGRPDRALVLAERLDKIWRSSESAALVTESLRVLERNERLESFVEALPPHVRDSPRVGLVLALHARDRGDEAAARSILSRLDPSSKTAAVHRALRRPLAEWPNGLHGMMGAQLGQSDLERPRVWPPGY